VQGVQSPHRGLQTWVNTHKIRVIRLHYDADPKKGDGEKVFVPQINRDLSPWAKAEFDRTTDANNFLREYEIDSNAKSGQLVYQLHREATLEQSFPIPKHWTRYWGLDPHQRRPHASLWIAVAPSGDAYAYRELWPSKVCGKPGKVPEDDNRIRVKDYLQTVKWLQSGAEETLKINDVEHEGNPENIYGPERIWRQVIDYAARGFKDTSDSKDQRNMQQRFEDAARDIHFDLRFEDAIKDVATGIEVVNDWLKPRLVESNGQWVSKSKLHIFQDKCPEFVHELNTNRYPQLTPLMAERKDPEEKPLQQRKHMTDNAKYLCLTGLDYVAQNHNVHSTWKPIVEGVAF
jgi:quinol monooxygenase YgiN